LYKELLNYLPTDGGVILPGVAPDGTTHTELMLTYMQTHGVTKANKLHVYDAGYIKLREEFI
jgi:hypothetical protein